MYQNSISNIHVHYSIVLSFLSFSLIFKALFAIMLRLFLFSIFRFVPFSFLFYHKKVINIIHFIFFFLFNSLIFSGLLIFFLFHRRCILLHWNENTTIKFTHRIEMIGFLCFWFRMFFCVWFLMKWFCFICVLIMFMFFFLNDLFFIFFIQLSVLFNIIFLLVFT